MKQALRKHLPKLHPIAGLLIGFSVFFLFWFQQIDHSINWQDTYTKGHIFGENCGYSVENTADKTWDEIFRQHHQLTPLKMPYRDAPLEKRPVATLGQYIFVRCSVDFSAFDQNQYLTMQLGNIFGEAAIYIDQNLVHTQTDNGNVQLSVPPAARKAATQITMIAKATPTAQAPGPASLLPLVYTDQREVIDSINRAYSFWNIEQPAFLVGYSTALFLYFAIAWIFGIRYRDVNWMIVTLALLALAQYVSYTPVGKASHSVYLFGQVLIFAPLVALAAFVSAFLRLPIKSWWQEGMFTALVSTYALATYLLPMAWQRRIDLRHFISFSIVTILFAILTVITFKQLSQTSGSRRKRVQIILGLNILATGVFFLQAFLSRTNAWELDLYAIFGFATIFAAYLSVDLVVFYRQYLEEKARRNIEELEKLKLEERIKLGQSVQEILLPKKLHDQFQNFNYQMLYKPALNMAGDWIFVWPVNSQERRLLFGDVMGKGPQAAIVMASIITVLYECRKRQFSIKDTIHYLNDTISNLYDQRITTTFMSATLLPNRQVEVHNCGSIGWWTIKNGILKPIPQRSSALGLGKALTVEPITLSLEEQETLIAFSDGVVEGSRALKRFSTELAQLRSVDPRDLHEMAKRHQLTHRTSTLTEGHQTDDETTIVITAA